MKKICGGKRERERELGTDGVGEKGNHRAAMF